MSDNIDRRIVEMRFDNKDFEKNVGKTLVSLETLQEALNMANSEKNIDAVKKGLLGLGKAAGSIKTDNVSENVEQIANRFSTLGIIGTTVLQNIGYRIADLAFQIKNKLLAPLNYIKQGGLTRAFNLEQANFQLSGLGIEKNDTAGYYTEVMDAVLGTAYSYDVAAKAASQLAASDVGVTEKTKKMLNGQEKTVKYMTGEMTDAILGIAGVASMTGSSFEEISQIFTRVAGQGRLMSNDLNSISARGLNAAATLGNYLGKSEKEVRDMVTKGKIDFETFSKAMTEAFGSHAKDSTKTFTGALEDVKAALARIGADFYGPALTGARDILNSITPLVDVIHDRIQWALDDSGALIGKYAKKISGALDLISLSGATFGTKINREFSPAVSIVSNGTKSISESIKGIKGSNKIFEYLGKELGTTGKQAKAFAEQGKVSFKDWMFALNKYVKSGKAGSSEVRQYLADLSSELRRYENVADNLGITQGLMNDAFKRFAKIMDVDVDKVYEAVGEKLGKTGKELKEAVANGELSLTDFRGALNELVKDGAITDEQFHKVIDVMDAFILTDERLTEKIRDAQIVWQGFTSTLHVLFEIAGHVASIFVSLLAKLAPVGSVILGFLKKFNIWIAGVDAGTTTAGAAFDNFKKKLDSFKDVLDNLDEKIASVGASIKKFVANIREKLSNIEVFDTIKTKVSDLFASLKKAIGSFDIERIIKLLGTLVKGGLLFNFYKMIVSLGKGIQKTGLSYFLFGETFNQFRLYLYDLQNTIKYDHILKLAKGVAILAGSMWLLSTIDDEKLKTAGATMTLLIGELYAASTFLNKGLIGLFSKSAFIQLGISLALLATAVKILSTIDAEGCIKGLLAIKILFKELGSFMTLLSNPAFIEAGPMIALMAKAMKKIAVALILLCIPIKILGSMDIQSLAKGLGSIGVALLIFSGFFKLLNTKAIGTTAPRIASISKSLLVLAIAMGLLIIPIKVLGGMDIIDLAKGLGSIAVALLIFAGFFALINSKVIGTSAPRIAKIAGSLVVFAIALGLLAIPIKVLGSMKLEDLQKGLTAVAIALVEFAAFAGAMKAMTVTGKDMLVVAGSMILMSTAINIMAVALYALSSFNAGPGLSTLFASLLILAVACHALNGAIVGAAAMMVIGAALMMLAPALALLSTLNITGVFVGLLALAGTIAIFAGASLLLAPIIPIMLALAGVITIFGVGVLALGAGLTLLAAAFAVGITPIVNGLIAITDALPKILENLAHAIGVFLETLVEELPKLVPLLEGIFEIFAQCVTTYVPKLAEIGLELITALLEAIDGKIDVIVNLALEIVIKFVDGIASKIGEVVEAGFNLVLQFCNGVADAIAENGPMLIDSLNSILLALLETVVSAIPIFGDKAADAIEEYRQGLNSGKEEVAESAKDISDETAENLKVDSADVSKNTKKLTDTLTKDLDDAGKKSKETSEKTSKNVRDGLKKYMSEANPIGKDTGQGYVDGLTSKIDDAYNAGYKIGEAGVRGEKDGAGVHSPSWKGYETGMYLVAGFINGMLGSSGKANKTASNIATEVVGSYNSALQSMDSISGFTFSSSITKASDVNLRMSGVERENQKLASSIDSLTDQLDSMTETMNSRSLNNYINIDGTSDPEAFADGLIRSFRLNARTV